MHRPVLWLTGPLWKIRVTFSSLPGKGLGAVKSTSWKDTLKTRSWSTDVTDRKPLVTVPLTRALRELLRKGVTSWRAKQSHERPEGLTLRTVHCISLSLIWDGKVSAYNAGDLGSIPRSGRSPGEGNDNPLQYSCLENPMDQGAWWATVHGVAKNRTQLSDFTSLQRYLFFTISDWG